MMLVTFTITCLLGLALCNPIPQQQRLDEYQIEQFPVLPTIGEPLSQSPLPLEPVGINTASPPIEPSNCQTACKTNQTNPLAPTQPPAPLHSSSQSLSSDQTQSVESQSESSQEVTSDESSEDSSSESLPNTSEDTTSEEMGINPHGQQLMGHMLDEINGDTQDNSLGSEENMRRSRILAFGIPLRPQVAPEPAIAMATHSPSGSEGASVRPAVHTAAAAASMEPDSAGNSLESAECTATGDNGACVHAGVFHPVAEGDQHGPGLGLLMLDEERGQLHL
ncbi:proline-, glutamic acid- and leucine-rich protein 1-like [Sardina pilchardus]|uniref:proline-, glutamic acid- and leucine-rich protein 1-like n=1 Tax=Sardina pilchardus TaxID=27697 RepID=UPI002E11BCA7